MMLSASLGWFCCRAISARAWRPLLGDFTQKMGRDAGETEPISLRKKAWAQAGPEQAVLLRAGPEQAVLLRAGPGQAALLRAGAH